jgi:DNA polymerase III alpha subunit (gram-positive type)
LVDVKVSPYEVPIEKTIEENINRATYEALKAQEEYEKSKIKPEDKPKEKVFKKQKMSAEINGVVTPLKDIPASEVQIIEYVQKFGVPKYVIVGDIVQAEIKEVKGGYKIYEATITDNED